MRLAAWNVNSLKVRLPQLLEWLAAQQPDVVCLQETKVEDHNFPQQALAAAGYQAVFCGQKTYNGVALLSRETATEVVCANPHIVCEQMRVISAYIPHGQSVGSEKYAYKLAWLAALETWLAEQLAIYPQLAIAGDFNIAPEDRDVHNPAAWEGQVLCSEPERAAFRRLLALGLQDSFRLFAQPEKTFSWWDYRMLGFQKNQGLRIDHILLSPALAQRCSAARIDREMRKRERPSDHAPVIADID